MVAVRPSALFRRSGMGVYRTLLNLWIGQQWSKAANAIGADPARPGQGPLRVEMFEQISPPLQGGRCTTRLSAKIDAGTLPRPRAAACSDRGVRNRLTFGSRLRHVD